MGVPAEVKAKSGWSGPTAGNDGIVAFFALACGITWALDFPLAWAYATGAQPPSYASALVGLGAFGPTLAALIVARRRGGVRRVFGSWRAHPRWIVLGLLLPVLLHLPAKGLEALFGGPVEQWFYPPVTAAHVLALFFFSLGEEPGWRGFAYPRLAQRFGPVAASLLLGVVWGLWHLGMFFTPEHGAPAATTLLFYLADLACWSVVIAWLFERSNRSLTVAIAIHAGGHLDNHHRIPEDALRLRLLHLAVVAAAAVLAAHQLRKRAATKPAAIRRTDAIAFASRFDERESPSVGKRLEQDNERIRS